MRAKLLVAVAVVCTLSNVTAFAAHRVEQRATMTAPPNVPAPPPTINVVVWDGGKMRSDQGTQQTTIIDFKTDKMWMLQHAKKEYVETTMTEVMKTMQDSLAMMKKQLEQAPPEQRKAFAAMFDTSGKIALKATGEAGTMIGFAVKKFVLQQGGKDAGEVWFTKAIDMSDVAPYAKKFAEMSKGAMGANWAEILAKNENGYAMKTVVTMDMMGTKSSYTTETIKYDKVPSDPSLFELPVGYKKAAPPKMPTPLPATP